MIRRGSEGTLPRDFTLGNCTTTGPAARLFTLSLSALPAHASAQDAESGAFAICAARDTPEVCRCADDVLGTAVEAEDLNIYNAMGTDFADRLAAGASWVDAWEAAADKVGQARGISSGLTARMNTVGRAHRDAIRSCGG